MKQVHPNYTFVASTKTITLTGLNIPQDQLLLITNATRGVIYYNFASSSHKATVTAGANTTVVLTDASTTGHADNDQLVIHYEDQSSTQPISASALPLPSGAATSENQTTANTSLSNIGLATGAPADSAASSDTGTFGLIGLFKRLLQRITTLVPANLTVTSTRLLVDGSGVTQPISGTVTANAIGYNYQENAPTQIPIRFDGSDTNFVAIGPSLDPLPIPVSASSLPLPSGASTSANQTTTNTSLGAINEAAASTDTATSGINGLLKRLLQRITTLVPANLTVSATRLLVDAGTVTANEQFQPTTGFFFLNAGNSSAIDCRGYSWLFLTADGLNSGSWDRWVQWSNNNSNWSGGGTSQRGAPVHFWNGSNWIQANSLNVTTDTENSPQSGTTLFAIPVLGRYFRIQSSSQGEQDGINYRYILNNSNFNPQVAGLTVTAASDKGSVSQASTQSITTGGTHQQVFAANSSRKYLLIQNISDTDMYLGIGFNPSNTTPAGLLLPMSGGGFVFESNYIPTSEIRIVCATAGKRFVALQG